MPRRRCSRSRTERHRPPDELRATLRGTDPLNGSRLTPNNRKVPGFDATFSAPRSVSLPHGLGSDEVRQQVTEVHDAAVAAAVGYLELVRRQSSAAKLYSKTQGQAT